MDVLIVDDDADSCRLLEKQLRASGHDVRSADNGAEALSEALVRPPQLIITDILMPEMDGFQLCMEWKLNETLRDIPLVFYSATYTSDQDEKFALSLGADGFVRKPTEWPEFEQIISDVIKSRQAVPVSRPQFDPAEYSWFSTEYSKRLLSKLVSKVAQLETDIAERKKIEEELNLEAQLLDAATDVIYVTDLDWTVLYVNQASCTNLGYSREELLGRHLRDFIAADDLQNLHEAEGQDEFVLQLAHVRKDATIMPAEMHSQLINWGGRKVRMAVVRDITERMKTETRLRESHSQLERVLKGTLDVIEQIVEVRDPYTSGHQRRVAELAVAIARQMELPEESCVSVIRTAAVIHDIGKTTVPSEILSKPGRLTDAEFRLLMEHSQVGYDIIKHANLPDPVAEIVLQHHERLDGSGYPRHLSGDDILPEAQILAVADVVEAMSSHRPYRPALGINAALEEITTGSGTRYYPDVVAACLAVFRENSFAFSA